VILERDIGLELSRATLDGWVLKVGELLIPMVAAMRRELISGSYIQADETPVDVQTREGRGKNLQAHLWQYSRPGGSVVFDFRLGRGRDGPKRFLGQFEGILQTDGYAAYDQIGGPRMVHAACWSHARRQFFEAVQLNPRDPVATPIVAQMDELFAVDAEARRKTLTTAARHIRRQETAKPLLDDIRNNILRHIGRRFLTHEEYFGFGGEPSDSSSGFDSVQTWESNIQQNQVGLQFFGFLNGF
jgi:transposase